MSGCWPELLEELRAVPFGVETKKGFLPIVINIHKLMLVQLSQINKCADQIGNVKTIIGK